MSDVSYAGPLNQWLAQAPPQPPPRVMGKSLAELLGPYLGITKPGQDIRPMGVAQPDVIGNRPGVQEAVKSAGASAIEPFGQLGRVMTGASENMPMDIAGAALGLAPIGPPGKGAALKAGVEVAEGALKKGTTGTLSDFITAYHGSPHDFDKFDLSKIGTGEGAQAYGHGLYFAEQEGVARDYRDKLGIGAADLNKDPKALAHFWLNEFRGDRDAAVKYLRGPAPNMPKGAVERNEAAAGHLEKGTEGRAPGRMYQVAIKAPSEHFLDWDKPLSEQHPKVISGMHKAGWSVPEKPPTPQDIANLREKYGEWGKMQADALEGTMARPASEFVPKNFNDTKALAEAGIPGIKYLDQGSRAGTWKIPQLEADLKFWKSAGHDVDPDKQAANVADIERQLADARGKDTRNFVVFDDRLIDILKKYGIAGIGALPAMNAYHYQDKGN